MQEGKFVDLVPVGPGQVFEAYGGFGLEIFYSFTRASRKDYDAYGYPFKFEWDVFPLDDDMEPEEYSETCCTGLGHLEVTFLVIPNAIGTNVEVKLKLQDLGRSRAAYGKIKASSADYGNRSVHLFCCGKGRSWPVPSGPMSILPLSPGVIAVPYRRQLELHIEVDLIVITIFDDNQEEYKNLKFDLTFNRGSRIQEREVDDDKLR